MRVLVAGGGGLLAAAIVRQFGAGWDVLPLDRARLDITDAAAVDRVIAGAKPDVVVNCAVFGDVDAAEDAAVSALDVNALAVLALARAAHRSGAAFVHYSTDFVFDGKATRPYVEEDAPNPLGVYGSSKLLGEWFALEHPNGYVLRVESLFGRPHGGTSRRGSVETIIARIRAGDPVPVFVDRTASPTYTDDVAVATRELLTACGTPGLFHCVNSGAATWAEIATEAARLLGRELQLVPMTLETVSLKARRPKFCALSNAKLAAAGIAMPSWQDALQRHLSTAG